jgi:tripartite-type tricarboxylate transporter receptor subunit TctC
MPPGVPIERANYLRKIMMTCLKDQELLKKAKRVKLTVAPLPGEKVKQYVDQTFKISPEETKRLKYLLLEKYQ